MKKTIVIAISSVLFLAGCTSKSTSSNPSVYKQSDINKIQEIKYVNITNIEPAKIAINNYKSKNTARVIGGALGAIGGAVLGYNWGGGRTGATAVGGAVGGTLGGLGAQAMDDEKVVDGVTLYYQEGDKTLSSTQVSKACEFSIGRAKVVMMNGGITRIWPNSVCH